MLLQVVEDGYEFFAKRQLVTLFSAPNYCGEFDNAGGMMSVDETLMCSFQVLFTLSWTCRLVWSLLCTKYLSYFTLCKLTIYVINNGRCRYRRIIGELDKNRGELSEPFLWIWKISKTLRIFFKTGAVWKFLSGSSDRAILFSIVLNGCSWCFSITFAYNGVLNNQIGGTLLIFKMRQTISYSSDLETIREEGQVPIQWPEYRQKGLPSLEEGVTWTMEPRVVVHSTSLSFVPNHVWHPQRGCSCIKI